MKRINIIGAGFSSLSAACYLAKQGFQVEVFEKNSTLGGRARQYKEAGFIFDIGPTWYWMPDIFEKFFNDFSKKPSDYYKLEKLDLGTRAWTCPNCGSFHDRDINAARNILRVGQIDCYGEATKSQATGDLELIIPLALQKMTGKIERSDICLSVGHGSGQAARSLVVQ